jgi:hypothetical protein
LALVVLETPVLIPAPQIQELLVAVQSLAPLRLPVEGLDQRSFRGMAAQAALAAAVVAETIN